MKGLDGNELGFLKLPDMSQYFGEEFVMLEWALKKMEEAIGSNDFMLMYERIRDLRTAWSNIDLVMSNNADTCYNTEYMLMKLLVGKRMESCKDLLPGIRQDCMRMTGVAAEFLRRARNTMDLQDKKIEKLRKSKNK